MSNKKIIFLVLLVVVAGAVAAAVMTTKKAVAPQTQVVKNSAAGSSKDTVSNGSVKVRRTDVPMTSLPKDFPRGIPLEKDAKVLQNYNAETDSGVLQATRTFETAKSPDENFSLYSKWFQDNAWKIVANVNNDTVKFLSAQKEAASIQITIAQNSQTKARTVDITYTEEPKK